MESGQRLNELRTYGVNDLRGEGIKGVSKLRGDGIKGVSKLRATTIVGVILFSITHTLVTFTA